MGRVKLRPWRERYRKPWKNPASAENGKTGGRPRHHYWRNTMKRSPKDGQQKLVHRTQNTDDSKEFALTWKNYDPRAIRVCARMFETGELVGGFRLARQPTGFDVWCVS